VRALAKVARKLGLTKVSTPSGYTLELGPLPTPANERRPAVQTVDPYDRLVAQARAQHDTLFASSSVKPPFVPPPRPKAGA